MTAQSAGSWVPTLVSLLHHQQSISPHGPRWLPEHQTPGPRSWQQAGRSGREKYTSFLSGHFSSCMGHFHLCSMAQKLATWAHLDARGTGALFLDDSTPSLNQVFYESKKGRTVTRGQLASSFCLKCWARLNENEHFTEGKACLDNYGSLGVRQ